MAKTLVKNRRATYDYTPVLTVVAGLELLGSEVKSLRHGEADLKGAYVTLKGTEAYLTNAHIKLYKYASLSNYDPTRPRKLLLKKAELAKLVAAKQNGLALIPLAFELHGKFIKLRLATAQAKKKHDKRQDIKKRQSEREARLI